MSNQDLTTVRDLILLKNTGRALLVRDLNGEEHWLPLSQCENISYGDNVTDSKTKQPAKEINSLDIPEWLAEDKGLQ